jgi:hypothetical protein
MLHSSKYFSAKEFACKCGCGFGSSEVTIADDLIHALHCLRIKLGVPFKITSGARCVTHNTTVGGGTKSTHLPGVLGQCTPGYEGLTRAADIDTTGWSITLRAEAVQMALAMGLRVGIATTFLHFDVENAPYYGEGMWNYGLKEDSSGGQA